MPPILAEPKPLRPPSPHKQTPTESVPTDISTTSRFLGLPSSLDLSPILSPFDTDSDNSTAHKKSRSFSFIRSKHDQKSSLAVGEASIVQPTSPNDASTKEKPAKPAKKEPKKELDSSITDKLMEKLVAAALPTSALNLANTQQRAIHMKSNTPFNIPVMGRNFRNMTARTGVIYDSYYAALRIVSWQSPSHTLSVLAIYSLIVLNPRLIPTIPFFFLLTYSMAPAYFYRHPPDPTLLYSNKKLSTIIAASDYQPPQPSEDSPNPSSPNATSPTPPALPNLATSNPSATDVLIHHNISPVISNGPPLGDPIIPRPVPEISREFYMNMVDTQNAMDIYVQLYDVLLALLRRFAFFDGDETTSSLMYVVLIACLFASYYMTPFLLAYMPWKVIFLAVGWGAVVQCHPRYDQEKVLKPIKKELRKTKEKGKKTFKKVVKNIQERQKKHRSDSNVSSLSLDVSREEVKAEKDYRDDISIDSTLESEESESDSSDSEPHDSPNTHPIDLTDSMDLIDSTEDTLPLPYAEVYIRYKSLLKRAFTSASGSLGLLNIFQSPFWDQVHKTAYTEFNHYDPLDQKTVEIFEFQFARTRVPSWAPRTAANELVWDRWDQDNQTEEAATTKNQTNSMDRVFTNWESSVYASTSLVPRVKLFASCTSRAQLAQLETVLATLADSDEPKTEKEMEKEKGTEREARRAAETAGAHDPFVLPGLVVLAEIQAPPFWQFVSGTQWQMDMHVAEWVRECGVDLSESNELGESTTLSSDGKFLVDFDEKWVYNTEPITFQSERLPEQSSSSQKSAEQGDVIWVRRRRWTRVCIRHQVVREVTK